MTVSPQAEAVIDLDAYRTNLATLSALAPTSQAMAVVKANAYGHGMAQCARAARDAGMEWLGVATLEEARLLRAGGDRGEILCWLASPGADFVEVIDSGIQVTASSAGQFADIVAAGKGRRPKIQLKVDTGLSRNGAAGEQWPALVEAAASAHRAGIAEITGVWSHFACADEPGNRANDAQETAFRKAVEDLESVGLGHVMRHLSNSAAALTRPSAHFDLIRLGIASYGLTPALGLEYNCKLKPVMTLRARLAAVKRVPAGSGVSYGHTYVTSRETTLGLVPAGYGEGILRSASNKAEVQFAGERAPVAGIICMDQFVVDLGDRPANVGDTVVLFGPGDDGEPTVADWAEAAGAITYEVVTRLGGRIQRTFQGER